MDEIVKGIKIEGVDSSTLKYKLVRLSNNEFIIELDVGFNIVGQPKIEIDMEVPEEMKAGNSFFLETSNTALEMKDVIQIKESEISEITD